MKTTQNVVENANRVLKNARHYIWRQRQNASAKTKRLAKKLEDAIIITENVIEQTT